MQTPKFGMDSIFEKYMRSKIPLLRSVHCVIETKVYKITI